MHTDVKALLQAVQDGAVSVDDALLQLKQQPFEDLGYAKVDLHRKVRQGANEVIYGAGKTPEQIIGILEKMAQNGQENVRNGTENARAGSGICRICAGAKR